MPVQNQIPSDIKVYSKSEMHSFYLDDPIEGMIESELNNTRMRYFYFDKDLNLKTKRNEVLNGCILSGNATIEYDGTTDDFNQFDFFFLPPEKELKIKINQESNKKYKICLYSYIIEEEINADFEIQHYSLDKYVPRGEHGSKSKMATHRTVWTAIKNGYFMSGFTNIPNVSLKQGVITSVNLDENKEGNKEIYSHIHPEYPEVYIMCIDDDNYAISQYLINIQGQTVCRDLTDGEGLFFPGSLGHSNFSRPFYKDLKFCQYLWIIPTFNKADTIKPITLKV